MKEIYLYGKIKEDKYVTSHVSNDPEYLANKISSYLLKSVCVIGMLSLSALLMIM